jgi:hypothetical protein
MFCNGESGESGMTLDLSSTSRARGLTVDSFTPWLDFPTTNRKSRNRDFQALDLA